MIAEPRLRQRRQLVAFGNDGAPIVLALEIDRRWHGQKGGDITCAQPFIALDEAAAFVNAVRYHQRIYQRLMLRADVQKARSLWRAEPFVEIAAVHVSANGGQVKGQLSRGVRAVDDGGDAALAGALADLLNGKNQR